MNVTFAGVSAGIFCSTTAAAPRLTALVQEGRAVGTQARQGEEKVSWNHPTAVHGQAGNGTFQAAFHGEDLAFEKLIGKFGCAIVSSLLALNAYSHCCSCARNPR